MNLNQALAAVARARDLPVAQRLYLACGFEPLHLPTFLQAHYQARFPSGRLAVSSGHFGDLLGNVTRAASADATVAALVIEWGDLDPRLGLRSSGPWSGPGERQLRLDLATRLTALGDATLHLAARMPVVLLGPTIPFLLAGGTAGWQMSGLELELERLLAAFFERVATSPSLRVVHRERLAAASPPGARHDPGLELATGFPYLHPHTDAVAGALLALAFPATPKKGLITDLDDTLWSGLVGEVGPAGVSFSQADRTQLHGLYQSMLRQLAQAGVLLAVASKNDPAVVEAALRREDLIAGWDLFFPVYAGWGPKSAAVSAILASWNVAADSVVVIDDSPMEIEEVRSVHPDIVGLAFDGGNARQALAVLDQLRDLFGKPATLAEDGLRRASVQAAAAFRNDLGAGDAATFVRNLEGRVVFDRQAAPYNPRLPELINKTNQFNLNGLRVTEGEWRRFLASPDSVAVAVSYQDRYGNLGIVGVIAGVLADDALVVHHWVLSCRAFSRQIEHHMLGQMLALASGRELRLLYRKTDRNQPFEELLARLPGGPDAAGTIVLTGPAVTDWLVGQMPHQVERLVGGGGT